MLTQPTLAADDVTMLAVPHAPGPGETALLEITVGAIARGQEVDVSTPDGRPIGTVSPFGIRPGQVAGTYLIPVPADAIRDGKLPLRLRLTQLDGQPRAPTANEVSNLKLVITATRP